MQDHEGNKACLAGDASGDVVTACGRPAARGAVDVQNGRESTMTEA